MDKKILYKDIYVLGEEVTHLEISILVCKTWIRQINENLVVYQEYPQLFNLIYVSFYDQIIHSIFRLIDKQGEALSIVNILKRNIAKEDVFSKNEVISFNCHNIILVLFE